MSFDLFSTGGTKPSNSPPTFNGASWTGTPPAIAASTPTFRARSRPTAIFPNESSSYLTPTSAHCKAVAKQNLTINEKRAFHESISSSEVLPKPFRRAPFIRLLVWVDHSRHVGDTSRSLRGLELRAPFHTRVFNQSTMSSSLRFVSQNERGFHRSTTS